ncbi:MAG: OmpA family protein [Alphaproteobacteria bacterium]|nr:OmpA family protein [Alphaproteobacteria bacterium]
MKPMKLILCVVAAAMLSACADTGVWQNFSRNFTVNSNKATAERLSPVADPFQQTLVDGYRRLAAAEYSWQDYWSADVFYRKAIASASGPVGPSEPDFYWLLDADRQQALALRQQLLGWQAQTRSIDPRNAAAQQVNYDCWLENVAERQYVDAERCKPVFAVAQAQQQQVVTPPPPAAPRQFIVFFDWDRADITAEAQRVINDAVTEYRRSGRARVTLTGHADRSGPDTYNQRLSERRAVAVRDAMARLGVPAANISTVGRGESQPLVPTADGVREPQNRRVEISY